jgi:nucleoside-diphosphate-sugar epimerase
MELAVVNPVGVIGPVLGPDLSTSILIIQKLLDGSVPGCPKLTFGLVDVRDVADLHLRAMTDPAAAGRRFLAVGGPFLSMLAIARVLRARLGSAARKAPTFELPDFLVRLFARFDPAVAQITPELGQPKEATAEAARRVLGWAPRGNEDSIVDCARSLLALGLVKGMPTL